MSSYLQELQRLKLYGKQKAEKKAYVIPKKSAKKLAEEKLEKESRGSDNESELIKWYAGIMEREEGKCWETGERIDKRDKMGWHGSIAHVLDKGNFPSVAVHPMNYMILKMWGGTHGQYDSSWQNAAKMKVWPYAVKIINILYPLLSKEEKSKLPDIIIQEIKPELYNQ